jgi:lipid A 3-O-deacylase
LKIILRNFTLLLFLLITVSSLTFAQIEDPKLISMSGSYYDFNKRVNTAFEGEIEYRHDKGWWKIRPFAGIMHTTDGTYYIFGGGFANIFISEHFVITPSFAPGFFEHGNGKELNYDLEFRSQLEIAFRFTNGLRIGANVGHMSNANLGLPNPGVEYLGGTIAFPVNF